MSARRTEEMPAQVHVETDWDALAAPPIRTLPSGRTIEIGRAADLDRVTIRGRDGAVVLAIEVGDRGPVLRFESAELSIGAVGRLSLAADTIAIASRGDLATTVAGTHHTRVGGAERVEAARVEVQANDEEIVLRAREDVRIDGEHVGLNDDLCPGPLPWTSAAAEVA